MKSLTQREQLFVALGAAIGSNCVPCVKAILPRAKAAGIKDWELQRALRAADSVRQKPAARVLETAKAILDGTGGETLDDVSRSLNQIEGARVVVPEDENRTRNKSECCG